MPSRSSSWWRSPSPSASRSRRQSRALQQGSARAAHPFDLLIAAPGSETQLVLSAIYLQPASLDLLPGAVLAELQNDPRARFAAPIGFGDSYRGHPIVGVTPDLVAHLAGAGGGKVEGATLAHMTDAVLGSKVALDLGQSFVPMHGMAAFDDDEEAHEGFDYVSASATHSPQRSPPPSRPRPESRFGSASVCPNSASSSPSS